jgi:hypothetical protein
LGEGIVVTLNSKTDAKISPFDLYDHEIDLHIRIRSQDRHYTADVLSSEGVQTIVIEITPQDLAALNRQLQEAVESVVLEIAAADEITTKALETSLLSLAETGYYVFKKTFGSQHDIRTIQEVLGLDRHKSIQIASDPGSFFLPWELLYSLSPEQPLSIEHFWGMRYIISSVIASPARPRPHVSPVISVDALPKLGLFTDCKLPSVKEKEVPMFETLDKHSKISLSKLRALNPGHKLGELQELKSFCGNPFDLAHFACHASYEESSPNRSYVRLSDEFPITLTDIEVHSISFENGHPLIILNACRSGNLNPLYTSHFADVLLRYGARGVVVTQCDVPDDFAADFAEQLYAHLLAGEQLGYSLLQTRRHFLEKYGNPSGLLYSMYAPPTIRLESYTDLSPFLLQLMRYSTTWFERMR